MNTNVKVFKCTADEPQVWNENRSFSKERRPLIKSENQKALSRINTIESEERLIS